MELLRCLQCGKVLGEAEILDGIFKKICPRCKSLNEWEFIFDTFIINNKIKIKHKLIQKLK